MLELSCKHCGSDAFRKNGMTRGFQRYYCKSCGRNFTDTPRRGYSEALKALAIVLYGMGNAGFSMIGRLLGVSDVTVMRWVRDKAESLPEPETSGETLVLSLDEMWHFIQKKSENSGSGAPMTLFSSELSPGCWVGVMMQPCKHSSIKSG